MTYEEFQKKSDEIQKTFDNTVDNLQTLEEFDDTVVGTYNELRQKRKEFKKQREKDWTKARDLWQKDLGNLWEQFEKQLYRTAKIEKKIKNKDEFKECYVQARINSTTDRMDEIGLEFEKVINKKEPK